MSRIIVKNLPAKATEDAVRHHFETKGRITDVKILRKRDGSSRRFAFVGFKSDDEARAAVEYFNLTFMNSSRLQVALAKALHDESLNLRQTALKRKRQESANNSDPVASSSKKREASGDYPQTNAKLEEFIQVMQPQKTTALWKNDSTEHAQPTYDLTSNAQRADDDDDDIVDMKSHPAMRSDHYDEDIEDVSDRPDADEDMRGEERDTIELTESNSSNEDEDRREADSTSPSSPVPDQTEMSDLDWLRQRQTRIRENGDKPSSKPDSHNEEEDERAEPLAVEDAEEIHEPRKSNRLFLRNLAFTVEREELQDLFKPYGNVKSVHIPVDPKTDKQKGIAFVEFEDTEEAVSAQETLDGSSFQGRLLHILYAEPQRGYVLDEFDIKNMPLKKQQALRRRMQASKQQFSWNSLYMNPDTVLESTAAKLGISKSEMLDPTSSNMAVKAALAESSVLENVQTYFKSKGVDITRFKGSSELSDTVILAKNLPFHTSAEEIQDMFAKFGEIERTLMPQEGGIAIVQFKLASAGRAAFRKLAFRRIGDSILYLQKASKGVLDEPESISEQAAPSHSEAPKLASSARDMLLPDTSATASNESSEVRTSVFVKNLNFATQTSSLVKLFQALPGFVTAVVKTKPNTQNPDKKLSMGFGFVEFRTLSQAETAIKALQGHTLDGHSLQLKISSRGQDKQAQTPSSSHGSAKIVIKNIPFETSKKDIVDLLGTFGKLRSVRVPKKFNRQTRGFAFAEFATPGEAEHAMSALKGTHLLGRRLVMDFAEADAEDAETEIARMEAKVSKQVAAEDLHGRRIGHQQKGFDMDESE